MATLSFVALSVLGSSCSSKDSTPSIGSAPNGGGTSGTPPNTGGAAGSSSAVAGTNSSSGQSGNTAAGTGLGGSSGESSGGSMSGGSGGVAMASGGSSAAVAGSGGKAGSAGAGGTPGNGSACPVVSGGPPGLQPLPSAAQVAYQRTELTAFVHFSMATFDGSEQGNPSDQPSLFNPTNLNATTVNQWASSLKSAGFGQAMLVTKHSVGFTLWPSKYTDYSVKSSPWMNGQGDVVQLFSDAMKASAMRSALYLGPWDQKYTSSKSDYETYFKNQLSEILAYGPAYEVEFDGYNAPTGNVNWTSVFSHVKQLQPNILIWAGPEISKTGATPDLQWIGNENGQATRSTSSLDTKNCGGKSTWCAYECNVSSHRPNWFWHPNQNPISLADMQSIYFATVGMNCTLNFNIPPSQSGAFDAKDLNLLQQFATWYTSLYTTDLVQAQSVTADSTWAGAGFDAAKAVDNDVCSYWAAADGKKTARLEVTPAAPIAVKLISIREPIELGERATAYHVEIKQGGVWKTAPTDATGAAIKGTVIGQRQLWRLASTTAEAIALVIDSAKAAPAIAEFSVY